MRILAHAIRQRLTLTSSSGAFEELIEGSTKALAEVRTHAGICRVMRYRFTAFDNVSERSRDGPLWFRCERLLDKPADGLGPAWLIVLLLAPFIDSLQELVRDPHLELAILNLAWWPPHKCIDLYVCVSTFISEPGR